jgi:hypothetical protein
MRQFYGFWLAALFAIVVPHSAHAQSCMRNDNLSDSCQAVLQSNDVAPAPSSSSGVRLNKGVMNTLFNSYTNLCRYIDNPDGSDYFVPQKLSSEFSAFLTNSPPGVVIDNCVFPIAPAAASPISAAPTIPSAFYEIFAEEGAPAYDSVTAEMAPIGGIAVPTAQNVVRVGTTTVVSVISEQTPTPIRFYYTRHDCVTDPDGTVRCNTWTIREDQVLDFRADPSAPPGNDGHWTLVSVHPTYYVKELDNTWTPIQDGFADYRPPGPLSCTMNGVTYPDGATWTDQVASTATPTSAECPYGTGTRVDLFSTPTNYTCVNGVASVANSDIPVETGFTGSCSAAPACGAKNTAFPLGVFTDNPNGNDAGANAQFEADYDAFVATMGGARPTFMNTYVDFAQDPSNWVANAGWDAWSWALTGDDYVGPNSCTTPVIGIPMASNADGWGNVDTFFQQIIAGAYDDTYKGIVDAWEAEGYKTVQFRPGYEFDGNFMAWGPGNSSSPTRDGDFIAAFQRIASLMHSEGAAKGVTVQIAWDPDAINWTSESPFGLYPGDDYVDIIAVDMFSTPWPRDLTDWSTGGTTILTDQTVWASKAANRVHFWNYPDASYWDQQPTNGPGWSVLYTIAFAKQHGKPLSIPETGAGGDGASQGPTDEPEFPQWLSGVLSLAGQQGVTIQNVNIWATDQADGSWGFLNGEKPNEAASWNLYFGKGSVPQ